MTTALIIFIIMYAGMLFLQQYRPWIALSGAALFIILGLCGVYDFTPLDALAAVEYNVLLMIAGTMGVVTLFIDSKMPARLSEMLITRVPDVKWAILVLSLFAGVISAFVDNVATVLMVTPVGLAISKKLNVSPVPVLISIAVSSNLQGAATLVGDTTSILLGGYANMNFLEFFWMEGRLGIFFGVELGALVTAFIILFLFRKHKDKINAKVETDVTDYVPTVLLIGIVVLLIAASFLPAPTGNDILMELYDLRSGLICMAVCIVGIIRACCKDKPRRVLAHVLQELDRDTLLLLFGLFIVIRAIEVAGVIDAAADLFLKMSGDNIFLMYTLIVFASVLFSAFIDNIPYVMTMLPVVTGISLQMGVEPYLFYFGLLTGATLGGNLTPIGASANIVAIGILRKNGETVKLRDFLRIGVPFTLAAVLAGYLFLWFVWAP